MKTKMKRALVSLLVCLLVVGLCPKGTITVSAKFILSKTEAVHTYEGGSGSFRVYNDTGEQWSYMVTYRILSVKRVENEIRYTISRNDTNSYRQTAIMIIGKNGPVAEFHIMQSPKNPDVPAPAEATSVTLSSTSSTASYTQTTGSFTVTANGTFRTVTAASFIKT